MTGLTTCESDIQIIVFQTLCGRGRSWKSGIMGRGFALPAAESRPASTTCLNRPDAATSRRPTPCGSGWGASHIPVDDPFFLEWQQGAMFLCESFRDLEQVGEIATAVLVRPMVYQRL